GAPVFLSLGSHFPKVVDRRAHEALRTPATESQSATRRATDGRADRQTTDSCPHVGPLAARSALARGVVPSRAPGVAGAVRLPAYRQRPGRRPRERTAEARRLHLRTRRVS